MVGASAAARRHVDLARVGLGVSDEFRSGLWRWCCPLIEIYGMSRRDIASIRLDVRRPDHLAPLLGFVGDDLAEVAGEPGSTVPPRSVSRALILESERAALISLLSVSMISLGVSLGVPTP